MSGTRLVDDTLDLIFSTFRDSLPPPQTTSERLNDTRLVDYFAACSLVSKRWRTVALPYLFCDIVYSLRASEATEGAPYKGGARYRTLRMFRTFLQQNTAAARWISRLKLRVLPTTPNVGKVKSVLFTIPDFVYGPQDVVDADELAAVLASIPRLSALIMDDVIPAVPRPCLQSSLSRRTSLRELTIRFNTTMPPAPEEWNIQFDYAIIKILSFLGHIEHLDIAGTLIVHEAAELPPPDCMPDLSHVEISSLSLGYLIHHGPRRLVHQSFQTPSLARSLRTLELTAVNDDTIPAHEQLLGFVHRHLEELTFVADDFALAHAGRCTHLLTIPPAPNLRVLRLKARLRTFKPSLQHQSNSPSITRLTSYLRRLLSAHHPRLSQLVVHVDLVHGRVDDHGVVEGWLAGLPAGVLGDLDRALGELCGRFPSCSMVFVWHRGHEGPATLAQAFRPYLPRMVEMRRLTFCAGKETVVV